MKHLTICAVIALACLSACKKAYQGVVTPSFDVTTDSLVYNVNEPITFKVTGNADRVTFYSGETGHDYNFKGRTTVNGKAQMQFSTLRQYGAGAGVRDSTLSLLLSKDYNGQPTAIDIAKASWTDITARAVLAVGVGSTHVPSGVVDISDIATGDSAVYVAYRYHELQTNQTKRAWYVYDFTIDNVLNDSTKVHVASWGDMSFTPVNILNPLRAWYVYSTYCLMWGGNASYPETEDWIVSKPIFVNRVDRDAGVSIRNNPKALLEDYTFDGFKKPGKYTIVFEAINATQWDNKQILKTLTLTIK